MAGPGNINMGATVTLDPASIAQIQSALTKAVTGGLAPVTKNMKTISGLVAKNLTNSLGQAVAPAVKLSNATKDLQNSLNAVVKQSEGVAKNLGAGYDPRAIEAVNDQLNATAQLQKEITANAGNLSKADQSQLRIQLRGIEAGLKASKAAFQQSARSAIEKDKAIAASDRQASRVQIANINATRSANVVATQRASAQELAIIRSSTAQEVAATRAAAQVRVAIIAAASKAIVALERSMRAAFQGTASVIGNAFKGISSVATAAATKASTTIRTSNRSIEQSYATTYNNASKSVSNASTSISNSMRKQTSSVTNELNTQTSAVRNFVSTTTQQLGSLGTVSGGVKGGIGLAIGSIFGAGAAKMLTSGLERAMNLEDAQRKFQLFLGSAEKAAELTAEIVGVVTGTPFKLDQFANAAGQLLAFNFQAEHVPSILKIIGDAAAASGGRAGEMVDRLTLVLGQMSAAGKVSGGDMLQLTEAAIPAWQILGNKMGVTTGELRKMVEKGLVPADQAIHSLLVGIALGSDGVNGTTIAFQGLAKTLGETLRGSLANFRTAIARAGAGVVTAFGPTIVKMLGAATAGIDLLGAALKSLSVAITQNFVVKALGEAFSALGDQLVKAKTAMKPLFDFLSQGAIIVGTLAVAFQAMSFAPAILSAIAGAFAAILSPMTLFIAAAVVVAAFLKNLIDGSTALQTALSVVGRSIQAAFVPAIEALKTVLGAVRTAFSSFTDGVNTVAGSAKTFTESIGDFLIAKLQALSTFINTVVTPAIQRFSDFFVAKAVPAIERFAAFIQDRVLPAVRQFAIHAGDMASGAFATAVEFIRSTVIPTVGDALARALEIGSDALDKAQTGWDRFYAFASSTLVPFIKGNLIPVIGTLAAVIATISLTGNLPLAGLVAAVGGIAVVLSNEAIRNALIENIREGVERAREFLVGLVDGVTLAGVVKGILKVSNQVGKAIGEFISERDVVQPILVVVGAVAAAAVAIGAALIVGIGQGISENIPELVDMLRDGLGLALTTAAKALLSNPVIGGALIAVLFGASQLNKLRTAGKKAGEVAAQAMAQGAKGVSISAIGAGAGAGDFIRGIFGTPAQLQAEAAKQGAVVQKIVAQQVRQNQAVIKRLTGAQLPGPKGGLLNLADPDALRRTTDELKRLEGSMGTATVAGARFRVALSTIKAAFSERDATKLTSGIQGIGTALRTAGPAIAQSAGIAIGGALAAAITSQALFDLKSTGADQLQSLMGVIASGISVGLMTGSPLVGVASAALGAGLGFIQSVLTKNSEAAKVAKAAINEYAEAIRNASKEELPELFGTKVTGEIIKQSDDVLRVFRDINFQADEFGAAIDSGTVVREYGDIAGAAEAIKKGLSDVQIQNEILAQQGIDAREVFDPTTLLGQFGPLIDEMIRTNRPIEDIIAAMAVLTGTADISTAAMNRVRLEAGATGEDFEGATESTNLFEAAVASLIPTTEELGAAADALSTQLEGLKEARLGDLSGQVDAARTKLNEAETAANNARTAVEEFLKGPTDNTLEGQINAGITSANALAEQLNTQIPEAFASGSVTGGAAVAQTFEDLIAEADRILSTGIDTGQIVTPEDAAAALAPLIAAAGEAGGVGGEAAQQALQDKLASLLITTPEGQNFFDLAKVQSDADVVATTAQDALDAKELALNITAQLDPALFDASVAEVLTQAEGLGTAVDTGFTAGLEASGTANGAVTEWADALVTSAGTALGARSPSTKFAALGGFAVDGFVQGMTAAQGKAVSASASMAVAVIKTFSTMRPAMVVVGGQVVDGLVQGIRNGQSRVVTAMTAMVQAGIRAARVAAEATSPSKVAIRLGQDVATGVAIGVENETPAVAEAARVMAIDLAKSFVAGMKPGGEIVMGGIAIFEDDVEPRFTTVGETLGEAIGYGLAEQGASIVGSVDSIIDEVIHAAMSRAEGLELVGGAIASSLFGNMGEVGFGGEMAGGSAVAELQRQFMGLGDKLNEGFIENFAKFGAEAPTFNVGAAAGRANRDAFLEGGLAIRDYAQALIDAGRPLSNVIGETQAWRNVLIENARAMGASEEEINEMVRQLGLGDDQLAAFAANVNAVADAAAAGAAAADDLLRVERERIAAEKLAREAEEAAREAARQAEEDAREAERQAEENARRAEEEAEKEAERVRAAQERVRETRPPPIFGDMNLFLPSGDPEANALAVANRIAFGAARF